jgi:hypothetical protein
LRGARLLIVAALLCTSADSSAKVDKKFESWLGRTTAHVLESAYVGGKRQMTVGDIDPARAAFVRAVKSVLGDEPEIAKLSEVRPN